MSLGLFAWDVSHLRPPPMQNFRQAAYDSTLGWVSLSNLAIRDNFGPGLSLHTDAEGVRIHGITTAAPSGTRNVICSGASFTFGSGVADDDTFCARLESLLPGTHTLNIAQRGYGLDQSYMLYQRYGAKHPHVLHLFVVNGGDVDRSLMTDMNGYPKPVIRLRGGRLVTDNVPVPQWKGWSRSRDAVTLLPTLRIVQALRRKTQPGEDGQYARADVQLWPLMDSLFRALRRTNESFGSTPVMVYLPSLTDIESAPRDRRRARLQASARAAGIAFVDLTPDLREVPPDSLDWMFITPNALPVDGASGHYTAVGHRWVAERIARHLRDEPTAARALQLTAVPSRDTVTHHER